MMSLLKFYLKSISVGQKGAFFQSETYNLSVLNSIFIIQSLSNNQNKVNKQIFSDILRFFFRGFTGNQKKHAPRPHNVEKNLA